VAASNQPRIRLENITMRFGAVTALDDVTLEIAAGGIHGLIGENGAGKTTLMRILYGMQAPDRGRVVIDGTPVKLRSPRDALRLGLGMVHQHFMLVPELSVLENVVLGMPPVRGPFIDRQVARERLAARAPEAMKGLDLDSPAGNLSLGERQRVEILKLLYRDARVLILDEPTAVLAPTDAARLLADLRRLAGEGRTVILITHKLRDVMASTDMVSVLRAGRLISTRPTKEAGLDTLAMEIVGSASPAALEDLTGARPARAGEPGAPAPTRAPLVQLRNVTTSGVDGRGGLRGLDLTIRSGEIVAIVGVEGNGQADMARLLAGRTAATGGTIEAGGKALAPGHPLPSAPRAVGYIPEDRHRDAMIPGMTLARNLILGRQREARFRRGFFLDDRAIEAHASRLMAGHDIRPPEPGRKAGVFSGGNQQKAIVARELEETPELIVASHPTRGLDLVASRAVHDRLRQARDGGAAVALFTAELDEARHLGDRLVVLFEGRVAGELDPAAKDHEIGVLMTGCRPA
jgi:ABC-type uncharacterized transport system ATPase subunit